MEHLIIVGGGGHAAAVAEAAEETRLFKTIGYSDNSPTNLNLPYLGPDHCLLDYPGARVILGIGCVRANTVRERIVAGIGVTQERWAKIVSPSAYVSPTAQIGEGAVIMPRAVVHSRASIGAHAIINVGAVVNHDVAIGDYAHVAPCSVIGGHACVGRCCMIGMGAVIRDHVSIGDLCTVGMGAVVTANQANDLVLIGCPAHSMQRIPIGDMEGPMPKLGWR